MKTKVFFCLAILLSFVLESCTTAQKSHNSGEHDKVIEKLYYRAMKGSLKQNDLDIFQTALSIKIDKEREQLEKNIESSYYGAWKSGYVRLDYVSDLQNQIRTFRQLNYDSIRLIDVEAWDRQFADSLGQHHYDRFNDSQNRYFEDGNKNSLIRAYNALEKLAYFDTRGVDVDSMMNLFAKIGKRNIELVFRNKSEDENQLYHLESNVRPQDNKWSNFGTFTRPDFTAYIYLDKLNTYVTKDSKKENVSGSSRSGEILANSSAVTNKVLFKYTVRVKVHVEIFWNKDNDIVNRKSFDQKLFAFDVANYLVSGEKKVVSSRTIQSNGSDFMELNDTYYYDDLFQEALEIISERVEYYLESY